MNYQMTIWIILVGCLILGFLFRCIEKVREERTGKHNILEVGDENEIYGYDFGEQFEDFEDL